MLEKDTAIISSPSLVCTVIIENLTPLGTIKSSASYKNARIVMGRNEFRDIFIKMESGKTGLKFALRDFTIHKKFVGEGKATLHLKDQHVNIMMSNAPSNSLICLLKVLSGKRIAAEQNKENVSSRKRLFSTLPKTFDEISPLTVKEYETMRARQVGSSLNKGSNQSGCLNGVSPVSSKRPRIESPQSKSQAQNPAKVLKSLNPVVFNTNQRRVLMSVQAGQNVFFTGSAGTGKSFLLKRIVATLPPDVTYVTASTGVAACHIGGTTLHSFAGIGTGAASLEDCIRMAKRPVNAHLWKNCKHLIIDEISMVDGAFFKKMEAVARSVRGSDKPFGGIQLILSGDFFQLPPVVKRGEKRQFCFQSSAWHRCVSTNIELTAVKRQDDPLFIRILQELRRGSCNSDHEMTLKNTRDNVVEKDGIKATRLCTHREAVEHINKGHLDKLAGETKVYVSVDNDPHLADTLDASLPVQGKLTLKVGAQVMLMKNLDISKGLVNGARGVVVSLKGKDGLPVVKFACGVTKEFHREKWTLKGRGGLVLTRWQIPLTLAWAFSIHKSQGMTLDCVEMTLSKVFEPGQAYVALSRARNLRSIRILDFSPSCIKADPNVVDFYSSLRDEFDRS